MSVINNRIDWVDYAKGIGIILVVYGHVLRGVFEAGLDISTQLFVYEDSFIYSFHMPLFFFLSGLFANHMLKHTFSHVLKNKARTMLYPYFLWSIIQGGIMFFLSAYTNGSTTLADIVKIPIEPIAQFWFLYVLFLISILYFVLRSKLASNIVIVISFVLLCIAPLLNFWVLVPLGQNFFFFVLGSVMNKDKLGSLLTKKINFIAIPIYILINIILIESIGDKWAHHFLWSTAAVCGIYLVLFITINLKKKHHFLQYIGQNSIIIFVAHILAASGTRIFLLKVLGIDSVLIHLIAGTAAGILLPVLLFKICKKIKIIKYIL
ncbi:acyltransferase family protein [Listeria weihenstephanensis]|uniref:Acyltransferase family protein n=1 Tax=Listeria weihenstephanensis TaxID=1006155 RepID=A0A841Z749_9LIST|nr:acyltransferase family protein [Listeria weihenstephanensis]